MSLAGSRFSSDSAPRPFDHRIRRRGGTIFWATLPSMWLQVQAAVRTHLIPSREGHHSTVGRDPGAIAKALWSVDDGCMVLTDLDGRHISGRALLPVRIRSPLPAHCSARPKNQRASIVQFFIRCWGSRDPGNNQWRASSPKGAMSALSCTAARRASRRSGRTTHRTAAFPRRRKRLPLCSRWPCIPRALAIK
jgi:hypothetical protein